MEVQQLGPGVWWRRLQKQLVPKEFVFDDKGNDDLERWLGCYRKNLAEKELSQPLPRFSGGLS